MNDFWNNIFRYPRFFISSLVGLILIIVAPIRNLFKIPRFRLIGTASILGIFGLLYVILQKMVGL
jgi:Protein of unknown function (DUF751)